MKLILLRGSGSRREDLAGLAAVVIGLLVFLGSGRGVPGSVGLVLAAAGLMVAFVGALVSPKAGLAGVVAALPLYLAQRQFGSQSIALHEVALLVTLAAVVARAVGARLTPLLSHTLTPALSQRAREQPGHQAPPPHCDGEGAGGWGVNAWPAFDWPIALLLAAALLSLLATEYLRLSLRELRELLVEPVLFWYLCRAVLLAKRDVAWLVGALLVATTVVAVFGLAQLVIGGSVTDVQGVRRVEGTYTSPNAFALLLGRALPFALAGAWLLPRWRPALIVMGLLCAGALTATFSLGGWIATGVAILVVVGLLGGRRPLLALIVVGAIAGAVVLFGAPVARLSGRLNLGQGTSLARVQLWQAAIELIRQSPLFGIGLDNFLYRYPAALPDDASFEPNLSHPHNLLLQSWLELGLPGLIAMLWLLAAFGRLAWRQLRLAACSDVGSPLERALLVGALGSMTDFVVHGLVDNSYFLPDMAIIFWLTLAVAAASAIPALPRANEGLNRADLG